MLGKIDIRKCTSDHNLSTEKTFGLKALGLFHKIGEIFFGSNLEKNISHKILRRIADEI
jgi:hypothetical protein